MTTDSFTDNPYSRQASSLDPLPQTDIRQSLSDELCSAYFRIVRFRLLLFLGMLAVFGTFSCLFMLAGAVIMLSIKF